MIGDGIEILVSDLVSAGEAEIKTGPFGTQLHASDYVDSGIPVINVRNIGYGGIRQEKLEFISKATAQRLASHLLQTGDIVFGRKGAVDRHAFLAKEQSNWFQGSDCIRLRVKSPNIENRYLSYLFLTDEHKNWMLAQGSHGATMASLNQDIIGRIRLRLPSISTQRKIADILSAYDDLIENNTRRIAILEEMAQRLYREWFVDFRYPGHENVPLVESELGLIPEGWEVKRVADAFELIGGGTPSTREPSYWEGGDIAWYSPTDLTSNGGMFISNSTKHITKEGLRRSSAKVFSPYSVMMTSRATIGVTAINTTEACTNQGFITCLPNDSFSVYEIYYWLQESRDEILSRASGATFKEINRGTFRELLILRPDLTTRSRFVELVRPIWNEMETLSATIEVLTTFRDLLLPKLMSGTHFE